jgi:probable rRNA maturation factor
MIDNRSGQELPLGCVEGLAAFVLDCEGFLNPLEVSLSFVGLDEMTALNASYRDKPQPTDVLSFELDDPWASGTGQVGEDAPAPEGEDGHILIGDVVISPDVAREHALLDEVSFEEELWILVIHGILHLLGYDHEEPAEAAAMEAREDGYFRQWIAQREGL